MSTQPQLTSSFVDLALSRRLEMAELLPCKAVVELQQRKRPQLGCIQEEFAGGWAFYAGPGSPMNHAIGVGLYGPVPEPDFERLEEFYRSRSAPCEIVVSPYADRSLLEHAAKRGYRITEFNSVLVCELCRYEPVAPPPNISISSVGEAEMSDWARALSEGFAEVGTIPTEVFTPFAEIERNLCGVVRLDGELAGGTGGAIFPAASIAAMYGSATVPRFRRRGVQTALFHTRLAAAKRAGCELAVVMTQPGTSSQRNAERVGFRVAYTKIVFVREFN